MEKAKLTGGNAEETARLTRENEILRNIVVRERQEEARREQAKKLMLAEFDKLKIKSDTLNQQIEFLAQPVTKLTERNWLYCGSRWCRFPTKVQTPLKPAYLREASTPTQPVEPIVETTEKSVAAPETLHKVAFKPDVPAD